MKRCRNYCLALALAIIPSFASGAARDMMGQAGYPARSTPPVPTPIPPAPPLPSAAGYGASPHIIGNPGALFGPDVYPAAAIRAHEQGRTVARLEIDTAGVPSHCEVRVSSGSGALDNKTCEIALAQLRFTPARDQHGTATASSYMLPVRWVLPQSIPTARVSFSVLSHAEITGLGIVLNCVKKVEGSDPSNSAGDDCDDLRNDPDTARMTAELLGGRHAMVWIQTALTFDGDRPFRDDYKTAGRFAAGYTRVHFEIAPDGSVLGCEQMAQSGVMTVVNLCDGYIEHFVPHAGADRRGATLLFAVSAAPAGAAR